MTTPTLREALEAAVDAHAGWYLYEVATRQPVTHAREWAECQKPVCVSRRAALAGVGVPQEADPSAAPAPALAVAGKWANGGNAAPAALPGDGGPYTYPDDFTDAEIHAPATALDVERLLADLAQSAYVIAEGECFDRLMRWINSRRAAYAAAAGEGEG